MSETETRHETHADFEGYRHPDGRIGIRNNVLVLPSVICSHMVAESIADRSPDAIATPHDHGCAQLGEDNDQTERTLVNLGVNPNVSGTVVVGLGCEEVQSDTVTGALDDRNLPVREVSIQDVGGIDETIAAGVESVSSVHGETGDVTTAAASLEELAVGIVIGDIAASTIEQANPLVAGFVDRILDAGGQVLVAGNERFAAYPEQTKRRVREGIEHEVDTVLANAGGAPARATRVQADILKKGFDASTGFIGDQKIADIVEYGALAEQDGMSLVDAPSRFEEAATGLAAAGAHLVVHVTADGVPAGHPVVPVLKISGSADTLSALPDDIDVDARTATVDDLTDHVLRIADGAETAAERHGLTEFAITRLGPSM